MTTPAAPLRKHTGKEGALAALRARTPGQRTLDTTRMAIQALVMEQPERAGEVLDACRRHLPYWTSQQQLLIGRALFPMGGAIRTGFIEALGHIPHVVRATLETLVCQHDGHEGYEEALRRVEALGTMERFTFVGKTTKAALRIAMHSKLANSSLLTAMVPHVPFPEIPDVHDSEHIFKGWWACAAFVRHEGLSKPTRTINIDQAIDTLLGLGVPLQPPGEPCSGVACALALGDKGALTAFLDRGAQWEGLVVPEGMREALESHPAWRQHTLKQHITSVGDGPRRAPKL